MTWAGGEGPVATPVLHPVCRDRHAPFGRPRSQPYLQETQGLGLYNITKCCTEACPQSIRITENAIIPPKERAVVISNARLRWLGLRIR